MARRLAGEYVGLAIGKTRQHPVALGDKIGFRDVVAARMWHCRLQRHAEEQRIVFHARTLINTGQFACQRSPRHTIQVEHGGMGRKAGEKSGDGADLGPVDEVRQLRPIGLVAQVVGGGLGTGDDQGIDIGGLQETGIVIEAVHARARLFAALDAAQRKQPEAHIQRPGGVLQQAGELQLGGPHGGIGHVVDQPDMH